MGMKSFGLRHALLMSAAAFGLGMGAAVAPPAYAQEATRSYDIPSQSLDEALREFGRQTGRDVLFTPDAVAGKRSDALAGQMTERQALETLLAGTGLRFEQTRSGGYTVQDPNSSTRLGDADGASSSEDVGATPDILVVGRRTLNADIRRTEDDSQPYVVFSGEEIAQSGASNAEEFLRSRLPMNSQRQLIGQFTTSAGNEGGIDLRGLGAAQTLILVDGRRIPNVGIAGPFGFGQPNINGIPPAAIESIQILPATSSGIYGGGATGGVINIVLKRDYSGLDLQGSLGSSFRDDAGRGELSLSGGFSPNGGDTRLLFSFSHSEADGLSATDRDFSRRAGELNWANNPGAFVVAPAGYTPNVCSVLGASTLCFGPPLVLDNGTALNSPFTYVPLGYQGPLTDTGAALASTAGQLNFNPPSGSPLLQASSIDTAAFGVRHDFTNSLAGFIDFAFDRTSASSTGATQLGVNLPAASPNNPFQQDIRVSVAVPSLIARNERELENVSYRAGLIARLPHSWTTSLEHSFATTTSSYETAGLPTLSAAGQTFLQTVALQDPNAFPYDMSPYVTLSSTAFGPFEASLTSTTLRASGPVFDLPGGAITVSGYAEWREQQVEDAFSESTTGLVRWFPHKSQDVASYYLEGRIPIFSPANATPFAHQLELMAAVRRDEYSSSVAQGSFNYTLPSRAGPFPSLTYVTNELESVDYTFGFSYAPVPTITLRASIGTGFLPPNLAQINPSFFTFTDPSDPPGFIDPLRGNAPVDVPMTLVQGGNPDVQPEESESVSYGLVYTSDFLQGLRVSIDYVLTEKAGEIRTLGPEYWITNEAAFPGRITRGPNLPGDPVGWAGPITQIDDTAFNVATATVESVDFQVDYEWQTSHWGDWRAYLLASHQRVRERQTLPSDVPVDSVGFADGPLEWRGNFGLTWTDGAWTVGWNAQYYGDYLVYNSTDSSGTRATRALNQGSESVPSQVFHDIFVTYDLGGRALFAGSPLSNSELRFGIQNVFDEPPATLAFLSPLGQYSPYGDPRMRRFMLTFRTHFGAAG